MVLWQSGGSSLCNLGVGGEAFSKVDGSFWMSTPSILLSAFDLSLFCFSAVQESESEAKAPVLGSCLEMSLFPVITPSSGDGQVPLQIPGGREGAVAHTSPGEVLTRVSGPLGLPHLTGACLLTWWSCEAWK